MSLVVIHAPAALPAKVDPASEKKEVAASVKASAHPPASSVIDEKKQTPAKEPSAGNIT